MKHRKGVKTDFLPLLEFIMKYRKKARTYLVILFCAAITALNYQLFVFPNRFAPAGLNGICTMIQYITNLRVSELNLFINLPLAFIVFMRINKPFAVRSVVYTLGFSFFLGLLDYIPLDAIAYSTDNGTSTILGPLVAGIINGFSTSIVFQGGSSTGGLDYVAALIRARHPGVNFFYATFALNCSVAMASYFVYGFQIEPVILCIIYCFLTSTVSDSITKKTKTAAKFEIITHNPEELSRELIDKLHHTATRVDGTGMYSGKDISILICIINNRQLAEFGEIIRHYPGTFAYLIPVREVVGNFKHIDRNGKQEVDILDDGSDGTL